MNYMKEYMIYLLEVLTYMGKTNKIDRNKENFLALNLYCTDSDFMIQIKVQMLLYFYLIFSRLKLIIYILKQLKTILSNDSKIYLLFFCHNLVCLR